MTVTVVTSGEPEPGPAAPEAASVAFAAGVATAEAAQAGEAAEEAAETAEQAAATADLALDVAIANAGTCCTHCEANQMAIADLQQQQAATEQTAAVALEEATEPAPERVEPAAEPHTEPTHRQQYGSDKWFGRTG